jgi:serine/threonine-protein kinase
MLSFPAMPDAPGGGPPGTPKLIGPYRLERELARGGMGIVYLARDTRLDRIVALKALPEDVASDADRLQRFEREARLLASLSHPNVATIYGIESANGRRFLALEYIEGESLAARLTQGPLSVEETLDIGAQIAAGIEVAHEAGIIHRDLKPANVVIASGDRVKVIDFGLARGKDSDPGSQMDSPAITPSSPTVTRSPTEHSPSIPGVILGTAPYLSPEQARGKPVDRRTDIWSLGCVLFESLTRTMAFRGETVSDTISLILTSEPDWSKLPKDTPAALTALLRRCLVKDPRRRLRDIGEARLALEDIRAGAGSGMVAAGAAPAPPALAPLPWHRRLRLDTLVAGLLGVVVAAAFWNLVLGKSGRSSGEQVTHLSIALPPDLRVSGAATLSSDGRSFVVAADARNPKAGRPPRSQIYVRRLDRTTYEPLRGTELAQGFILTQDSKWVEYISAVSDRSFELQIFKIPIDGSAPPVLVTRAEDTWGKPIFLHSGDQIVPLANGKEYIRLPANGGPPSKPISFGTNAIVEAVTDVLPHDRGVLLLARAYNASTVGRGAGVLDLKSGKTKILIPDAGMSYYSPSGHIVFVRGSTLLAVPFDLGSLEIKGQPVAIMDGLRIPPGVNYSPFVITPAGTLLYLLGGDISSRQAILVDAGGHTSDWSSEHMPFQIQLNASPDGMRFLTQVQTGGRYEIWLSDRGSDRARQLVAVGGANCGFAVWSPDGRRIAYYQESGGATDGVYVVDVDGNTEARRIARTSADARLAPTSWSPDGSVLLATRYEGFRGALYAIDVLPGKAPWALFAGKSGLNGAAFSPDGRLIAYSSDETGRDEIYLNVWDPATRKTTGRPFQVSRDGGTGPRWGHDGKRLYFQTPENKIASVLVARAPALAASPPGVAWDLGAIGAALEFAGAPYDVLPDGRLLTLRRGPDEGEIDRFDIALHFDQELKAKLPK